MKKILSIIAVILVMTLVFTSCGTNEENTTAQNSESTSALEENTVKQTVKLGLLKGPTGMGAAGLLDADEKGTAKNDYEVTLAAAPDVLQTALINKELDMAALPTNVAAVLNAKTQGKVQILAVNTLGVIYLMSNSDEIKTVADLKGKTVLSAGKGTTTEYVLNYILSENSLTVGTDVTVEYAAEHAEVITKAVSGGYDVILLPEPFVTQMKSKDVGFNVVIDLTKEWKASADSELTMGAIAVRTEFYENNPEAVKAFLEDYTSSVKFVNEDTENASAVIEKFEIAKAAIASKAIPNCNIVLLTGEEMKTAVSSYLTVLHGFNAKAVGGAVPADSFYCIVK